MHPKSSILNFAGRALFEKDGDDPATLDPAAQRFHASHQRHAMTTKNGAILTLVLSRGPELSGPSQFVRADN